MRLCILFVLCTFLTCCVSVDNYKSKFVSTPAQALLNVKQMIIGFSGSGTCFPIHQDEEGTYFATAKHCVFDHMGNKQQIFIDNTEATVMNWSLDYDVAIIYAKGFHDLKPFRLGNSDLTLLYEVYVVGWHFGYQVTFNSGKVSMFRDSGFIHSAGMNPGCSGGPTLAYDMNGDLVVVGVNSAILTGNPYAPGFNGVAYSVSIEHVKDLIGSILCS